MADLDLWSSRWRRNWLAPIVYKIRSAQNWRKGYRFGPIQRCRWCGHTSPHHYPTCHTIPLDGPDA